MLVTQTFLRPRQHYTAMSVARTIVHKINVRNSSSITSNSLDNITPTASSSAEASETTTAVSGLSFFLLDKVLFPHTRMPLVILEPRYRLMINDVLKSESKSFGLVSLVPPNPAARITLETDWQGSNVGTMAKIIYSQPLKGDRMQIEVEGTDRFYITEKARNLFGVWQGSVNLFDETKAVNKQTLEEATKLASDSLAVLKNCLSRRAELEDDDLWPLLPGDLIQDLEKLIAKGNVNEFSFRLGSILPIDQQKHQQALGEKDPKERLKLQLTALNDFWHKQHSDELTPSSSSS